jgi:hypothetical protein
MTTRRANPSITGAPRPIHTSTRLSASRVFEILSRDSFSITVLILHATSNLSVYQSIASGPRARGYRY